MKAKYKLFATIVFAFAITVVSCSSSYNKKGKPIATNLLRSEQISTYTIPGFLFRYAMLATSETRELRPAFKGVSSVSISVSNDQNPSCKKFARINSTLNSHKIGRASCRERV